MPSPLAVARDYLSEHVKPRAQEIDRDPEVLREALRGLCERQLMALRRPEEYGGPALKEPEFRLFQEEVARVSGALAFLQTQHQSAGSMLSKSDNEDLKRRTLPFMADGGKLIGIGFSQLRRAGPPMLRAEPAEGGYKIDGTIPWATGLTFFPEILTGATLPEGDAMFAVVPFEPRPGIEISEPMRLAAMESPLTVTMRFTTWFVPAEDVCFVKRAGWIQNNDQINVTLQGHFALGCARAGLDLLLEAAEKKDLPFLKEAWGALDLELEACRAATAASPASEESTNERLQVRAWAIELAVRCAHAAVAAHSGAANMNDHPAQRVYREALVYTVSAQTSAIMEATLRRIARF